jgi:FAD/FMN-containing dehydrogenase
MSFSNRSGETMQTASHVSRRALLSGSAASLALPLLPRAARALEAQAVPESAWRELDDPKNMTGGVQRPNDPRFVTLTQPENLRYYNPPADPRKKPDPDAPFGVVRPHTPEQVAYAIAWARKYNLPMVPRSGGHSYAGCSTVAGLTINSAAMRTVELQDGLIVAGGGAIFGDLLDTLRDTEVNSQAGRYTITHGRCRGVGLSAFLMGGGWALDSSHLGMGCDRVKKVQLVLANGSVVIASEKPSEHPDLFWAIRGGGGGNLAYATKWWLEPVVVENVVVFSGSWRVDTVVAQPLFGDLLDALDATPPTMGAQMTLSATSGAYDSPWPFTITLRCAFHGSRAEFDRLLGSVLANIDKYVSKQCDSHVCASNDLLELPYWDAQEFFEERGYPNRYQETSLFAGKISGEFIADMFQIWRERPATIPAARVTVYRVGGKVNEVKPDATAFVHRTYRWMITTDIDWNDGGDPLLDKYLTWQRHVQDTFYKSLGGPGSYQNFPDPGLADPAKAYWGSNLARLSQIKKKYDPNSVFTPPRNQGIP